MKITIFPRAESNPTQAKTLDASGSEFLDILADEGNPSKACHNDKDKIDSEGFVLASYQPGAESKALKNLAHDSHTEIFCYDIDSMTEDEIAEAFPLWVNYSAVIYSTYKHAAGRPRYRLLVELSEPVPNREKEPYRSLYLAAADELKITPDASTLDQARLFFAPQHKPENVDQVTRMRFEGAPLDIKKLAQAVKLSERGKGSTQPRLKAEDSFEAIKDRPSRQELSALCRKLRKSRNDRISKVGTVFDAILRGEAFAPAGSVHTTSMHFAFELTRHYPRIDSDWFADEYLSKSWEAMAYEGSSFEARLESWGKLVDTAIEKHRDHARETEENKERVQRAEKAPLTPEDVRAASDMGGRLVMSHKGAYYVYSARCRSYKGPYKPGEVAVAVRECLGGVPEVTETEFAKNGGRRLKGGTELCYEYGGTVDSVVYFAKRPPQAWDAENEAICMQAYKWCRYDAVYHEVADELLHAVAGEHYPLLEAYLSQFRNLDQPLPALSLVGPRGIWKSRICEILSMFWTTPLAASPGKASKIMRRFNEHLLENPVIWSDEKLATSEHGRAQPEEYRQSITDRTHQVEPKGVKNCTLISAVRHVISVNDDEKIFSSEVDADSVEATMERFLLLYPDPDLVAAVERKWYKTPEMARLRAGKSLLEHIRWIEENRAYESRGRLFVKPHTEAQVLLRARFADDTIQYIWQVALEALEAEQGASHKNQLQRLPLVCDEEGQLRMSPGRVHSLWSSSPVTSGIAIRKPSVQRIGRALEKAGFKVDKGERASRSKHKGWRVRHDTLKQFLKVSDYAGWSDLAEWCVKLGMEKPK